MHRFQSTTRGHIVSLLRRATRTVDDLARALKLSNNAVRAHLARLERDGLVQQAGLKRGEARPAYLYDLTPQGEGLFPKAYGHLLVHLLDVLRDRLRAEEVRAILSEVGQRAAAEYASEAGDARARVEAAAEALNQLGGLTAVESEGEHFVIRGFSCPLAAALPEHPEVCLIGKALLEHVSGLAVREHCDRDSPVHCRFELFCGGEAAFV